MTDFSLLVPTRARPDNLDRLFRSVARTANVRRLEILVGYDEDDTTTAAYLAGRAPPWVGAVRFPRLDNLSRYFNLLTHHAQGDYLYVLNDDAELLSPGWDAAARARLHPFAYGQTFPDGSVIWRDDRHPYAEFPLVGRKAAEALGWTMSEAFPGHFADVYIFNVYDAAGLVVDLRPVARAAHHRVQDGTRGHMEAKPRPARTAADPADVERLEAASLARRRATRQAIAFPWRASMQGQHFAKDFSPPARYSISG